MKTKLPIWVAALGLLILFSTASATPVTDQYYGSNAHNRGDVITDPQVTIYEIDGMTASLSGNELTVVIQTNFAGHAGVETLWTTGHTGIGYGDLFLSTGWSPHGTGPHYLHDDAANGNHWTYAFSLDNAFGAGGSGNIYALDDGSNGNNNPGALLSNHYIDCSGCIYRNGQAVAVNKAHATEMSNNTGFWTVGDDSLSFTFDISGLDLDTSNLGLHWTMYCGNDVIEGLTQATVPEPASIGMFLLGFALIGLAILRRRKIALDVAPEKVRG